MVMEVVHEDIGEDSMHCSNHPHKNSTPGGICAFCLQEKLGKLVSSSYPSSVFPSSSSSVSSSPSSRSAFNGGATTSAAAGGGSASALRPPPRKSRLSPFVSAHNHKKKEKQSAMEMATDGSDSAAVFKRSNSIATPRRGNRSNNNNHSRNNMNRFLDESYDSYSPNRRGFWSFLYSSKHSTPKKGDGQLKDLSFHTPAHSAASTAVGSSSVRTNREEDDDDDEFVVVDENGIGIEMSPKVSRSRSVGCGSRSFSGDFFERISTGFGDCTLRRVESQREGGTANSKLKVQPMRRNVKNNGQDFMKSRVRCGGIFSSFMIASVEESNIKSRSWVWAFASPMRAFGKPPSGKRGAINNHKNDNSSSSKNASPNLGAIPSLLAVSG